jgi:cytochrome c-type biogenesis protein CcmE
VNRKARRRLLIAVAVVVVAFAGAVIWLVRAQGAYYRQVADLSAATLDGKTVKVGGAVVPGSINKDGNVQLFAIKDLTGQDSTVQVEYGGVVPDTFGPGVDVVVLGVYDAGKGLISAEELQTKCPSKYKASTSPTPGASSSP